jgi:hypothetical protein
MLRSAMSSDQSKFDFHQGLGLNDEYTLNVINYESITLSFCNWL